MVSSSAGSHFAIMEPPYQFIAQQLSQGQVVPFLGSAASIAGIVGSPSRLPSGPGLSKELIGHFGGYPGPVDDPLTKVAQYCEECVSGRTPLYNHLRTRFYETQAEAPIPPVADLLASIKNNLLTITTNYDPYVEAALRAKNRPYVTLTHITNPAHPNWGWLVVCDSRKPTELDIMVPDEFVLDLDETSVIYKMHGTFGENLTCAHDTIIITENDYIEFLVMTMEKHIPAAITRKLQEGHILFLGYSLEDWNLRVILRKLQHTVSLGVDYLSWAIQLDPSDVEREFWKKRNVQIYDADLSDFVEGIRNCS